jgi:hypothetical protein
MGLSKPVVLLMSAASLLVAATLGAGACSSSTPVTVPMSETLPKDVVVPPGISYQGMCTDHVYVAAVSGGGYFFCDDDLWSYTSVDPGPDGFTEDSSLDSTSDSDSSESESSSSSESGSCDDPDSCNASCGTVDDAGMLEGC